MTQSITLKSFAELADLFDAPELEASEEDPSVEEPSGLSRGLEVPLDAAPDLGALLTRLERSASELSAIAEADREARRLATEALERYDSLVREAEEAREVGERAREARLEAEGILSNAFGALAETASREVVDLATRIEALAAEATRARQSEADTLAEKPDVRRLLAERQTRAETEERRAQKCARAARLEELLAPIREPLHQMVEEGKLEEARSLLRGFAHEFPESEEVRALLKMVADRELHARVQTAERALDLARRDLRHDPERAIDTLVGLDLEGLPVPLSRQVFGEWARASARVCRERGLEEPLRYAPCPGRGVVFAREGSGPYVVVSSLGMDSWRAGEIVEERVASRARPLR